MRIFDNVFLIFVLCLIFYLIKCFIVDKLNAIENALALLHDKMLLMPKIDRDVETEKLEEMKYDIEDVSDKLKLMSMLNEQTNRYHKTIDWRVDNVTILPSSIYTINEYEVPERLNGICNLEPITIEGVYVIKNDYADYELDMDARTRVIILSLDSCNNKRVISEGSLGNFEICTFIYETYNNTLQEADGLYSCKTEIKTIIYLSKHLYENLLTRIMNISLKQHRIGIHMSLGKDVEIIKEENKVTTTASVTGFTLWFDTEIGKQFLKY